MTCILGLRYRDQTWVGADAWIGDDQEQFVMDVPKVLTYPHFVLGFAGSLRAAQILENYAKFRGPKKSETEDRYFSGHIVSEIQRALLAQGFIKDVKTDVDVNFLVATSTKVAVIQDDFAVISDRNGSVAIGSGSPATLGALRMAQLMDLKPKEAMEKAFQVGESLHPTVCGPYHIFKV